MSEADKLLLFAPFVPRIEHGFWDALVKHKADVARLSDAPIKATAFYSPLHRASTTAATGAPIVELDPLMVFNEHSLSPTSSGRGASVACRGTLYVFNLIESFQNADRNAILKAEAAELWADIVAASGKPGAMTGTVAQRFVILSFADLKRNKFHYISAFVAFLPASPFTVAPSPPEAEAPFASVDDVFPEHSLGKAYFRYLAAAETGPDDRAAFLVDTGADGTTVEGIRPLSALADAAASGKPLTIGLVDAVSPEAGSCGWPLRNLLTAVQVWAPGVRHVRVVSLRGRAVSNMLALTQDQGPDGVTGEPDDFGLADSVVLQVGLPAGNFASPTADQAPKATGWFRKAAGKKPTVRTLDLSALMDPLNIADTAARLNLSLMRWRLVPDLQLEAIANARCLVIGSGTLGCIVARNLVGWGVKSITMVDQSTVSYSNPVRQSLFEFADCANGGKPKAEAAVAALKRIHPLLDANAVNLSIPMPGHAFTEADAHQNYLRLSELIASHDVTFLLTDNRESRWLPTLLACSQNKVLINSALGFDSYLVARHGAAPDAEPHQPGSPRLGCYFCNDVMAPTDSTSQRTLDQMCTVTRPGLAYMAGSLAVEVMSTLLQHPLGVRAPAGITVGGLYAHESQMDSSGLAARDSAASTTCLGVVPHTIRGGVGHWGQRLILGEAYTRCIACSGSVVKALREAGGRGWGPAEAEADRQPGAPDGWDFIQRVLREPILLEDLTGISEIKNAADNIFVDDDDFLIDSDSD